jgi:small-conductance mechanosensitive channel
MIEAYESVNPTLLIVQRLSTTAVIIIIAVLIGLFVEQVVFPLLARLVRLTPWGRDDLLINVLRGWMTTLWLALVGIYVSVVGIDLRSEQFGIYWTIEGLNLSSRHADLLYRVLLVVFILSVSVVISRLIIGFFFLSKDTASTSNSALSIFNNIIRIIIFIIGALSVLKLFGVEITPLLAAVGVSGLAVSLALQDTLTNLFSGIQIILSNQVLPGNYVRLSSGEEGYVTDINWRTTKIRQLANNMVIIPNSMLTSAILTNYDDPAKELSILLDVGVSYESDLERVEEVTIAVAKEIMQEIEGAVPDNEPFIRYNAFQDFSINFTVILRGQEFVSQYLIKHEFIKRLHRRYKEEGIEIPFPIRTIYTREEKQHEEQ